MAGEYALIGLRRLVADDFDRREEVAKARLRQLALLVEQVALGDEDKAVLARQRLQRLARMGQRLDRVLQHLPPEAQDLGDDGGRNLAVGHLDRRLDHRQGEALHAEAVEAEVAALGLEQPGGDHVMRAVPGEQLGEALLCHAEEGLVLPQRVVGIEADGAEPRHHVPCDGRTVTGVPTTTWS